MRKMVKPKEYGNFKELEANETEGAFSVNVQRRYGARSIAIAPHGGQIEPGTSEIATAVAGSDLNLALFEGWRSRKGSVKALHITSANFDEPRCTGIVRISDYVLSFHGEKNKKDEIVYLGGLDRIMKEHLVIALREAGFKVAEHENIMLRGESGFNICNKGTRAIGVQFEITNRLRKSFFLSQRWYKGPIYRRKTTEVFERFVKAVRHGLQRGGAL